MPTEPALVIDDLRIAVGGATPVDGLGLTVGPGERWGLIGGSGAGKSLTAAAVAGLLPPGARASGSVRVAGTELVGAPERTLARVRGRGVTLMAQDSAVALNPLVRVGTQVARPLRTLHGLDRPAAAGRALDLLAALGLPDPGAVARARPPQLSGGQRQRAALAAALACDAALLVADEPTASLDPTVARGLLTTLDRALRPDGDRPAAALLLITHDLGILAAVCDHVAVLADGRVVESGRVADVVAAPRHRNTRDLVEAAHLLEPSGSVGTPGDAPAGVGEGATDTVTLRRVHHRYRVPGRRPWRRDVRTALDGVDLTLPAGRSLGLIGESGSGKSTLLRLLLGLERPDAGDIRFRGAPVAETLTTLRRVTGVVPQDPGTSLDPRLTVGASIAEPLECRGPGDHGERVAALLATVGLDPGVAGRRPAGFSGGERQRIALARALAAEPDVLVADEPFSALDPATRARLVELVEEIVAARGLQLVLVAHDLGVVERLCDDVAVLAAGRVVEHGAVADVLARPASATTRALLDAVPRLPSTPELAS